MSDKLGRKKICIHRFLYLTDSIIIRAALKVGMKLTICVLRYSINGARYDLKYFTSGFNNFGKE